MNSLSVSYRSSQRVLIIAWLLLSCGAVSGCLVSSECRSFYDLSYEQQEATIRASPVEKQIDLYKCGMYQHPPQDYASEIAEGGEKIIPVLLERLKADDSETFQDDLIHIFEEMAKKGYLHGRRDIVVQIRQVISTMEHDNIKRESQQRLKVIEDNL